MVTTDRKTRLLREALGARIVQLRADREWTQSTLAAKTGGLHQGFISKIETGQTEPCLGTLAVLAKAFGLTISELTEGIED